MGCTYCKDTLAREEAVYCAACLAAHHRDCFEEHGRCTAPGCGETRFVESRVSARRPRWRWRRPPRVVALAVLGAALVGGVAALTRSRVHLHAELNRKASIGYGIPTLDVDARDARLDAVVEAVARLSGKNIVVPPERKNRAITFYARGESWRWVLDVAARLSECDVQEEGGLYRLVYSPKIHWEMNGDVRQLILQLAAIGKTQIVVAPEVSGTVAVSFGEETPWRKALVEIVRTAGDFEVVEETPHLLRVVPRKAIEHAPKPEPPLPEDARHVTMFLDETDLSLAIELLGAYAEKKILVPEGLKETVTLELHNIHWLKALKAMVKTAGDYEVDEDQFENTLTVKKAGTRALVPVQDSRSFARPMEVGLVVRIEREKITVRDSTTERVFVVPPPDGALDPEVREGILSALGHVELGDRIALEYAVEKDDLVLRALVAGKKWN